MRSQSFKKIYRGHETCLIETAPLLVVFFNEIYTSGDPPENHPIHLSRDVYIRRKRKGMAEKNVNVRGFFLSTVLLMKLMGTRRGTWLQTDTRSRALPYSKRKDGSSAQSKHILAELVQEEKQ